MHGPPVPSPSHTRVAPCIPLSILVVAEMKAWRKNIARFNLHKDIVAPVCRAMPPATDSPLWMVQMQWPCNGGANGTTKPETRKNTETNIFSSLGYVVLNIEELNKDSNVWFHFLDANLLIIVIWVKQVFINGHEGWNKSSCCHVC